MTKEARILAGVYLAYRCGARMTNKTKTDHIETVRFSFWSGLVHDIRAYWKTKVGWFPIPQLYHDHASVA